MELPLVRADDLLAQPTRARLYTLLVETTQPAGTDQLARKLALHPNGIRAHLARLEEAGLVSKQKVGEGPGRPRFVWSAVPGARAGGESSGSYKELARWLARSIAAKPARLREVQAAGDEIGHQQAKAAIGAAGMSGLSATLAALGFSPAVSERREGGTLICLENCPYIDAVRENPKVVCALHQGITRGMLDEFSPGTELLSFEAKEPGRAGCLIELGPPR